VTDVLMMLLRTALTQHTSAAARLDKTNLPPARYLSRGRVQTKGTGFAQNLPARWTLLTQHRNRYAAALTVYEVLNTSINISVSRQQPSIEGGCGWCGYTDSKSKDMC
jgi:hypothetical protein